MGGLCCPGTMKNKKKKNLPDNFVLHGHYSRAGFDKDLAPKPNQDCIMTLEKEFFLPNENEDEEPIKKLIKLHGVCDGHGTFGREIAKLVSETLPDLIVEYLEKRFMRGLNSIPRVLEEAVKHVCKQVEGHEICCELSGCTLLFCLIYENILYTCNLGDSRAILARTIKNALIAAPLSKDQSPADKPHARRIHSRGGMTRIDEFGHDVLVAPTPRGNHTFTLGMASSVGDLQAHRYGLSHTPEISKHHLSNDDIFVLLGSDGIFEVLDNTEVAELLYITIKEKKEGGQADLTSICKNITKKCVGKWKEKNKRCDDITLIVLLLQEPKNWKSCSVDIPVEEFSPIWKTLTREDSSFRCSTIFIPDDLLQFQNSISVLSIEDSADFTLANPIFNGTDDSPHNVSSLPFISQSYHTFSSNSDLNPYLQPYNSESWKTPDEDLPLELKIDFSGIFPKNDHVESISFPHLNSRELEEECSSEALDCDEAIPTGLPVMIIADSINIDDITIASTSDLFNDV